MPHSRYEFVRERLIFLYNILQNRTYRIWIAPEKLMTLDQLRNRPTYTQEGFANDTNFYSEKQMRVYRIPQLLDLLGNIQDVYDFGFEKPSKSIVEIYDSIIEYIALWCEIIKNVPEFKSPSFTELRELENFAYLLFNEYKKIKPFVKREANNKQYELDSQLEDRGLAGFRALFGMTSMHARSRDEGISFYSHLDEIAPQHAVHSTQSYMPSPFDPFAPTYTQSPLQRQDTLFAHEMAHASDPNWIFKAG
jgi:hypothetical protein